MEPTSQKVSLLGLNNARAMIVPGFQRKYQLSLVLRLSLTQVGKEVQE
jgi:hypothetical protein